jgi:hypothetical protein
MLGLTLRWLTLTTSFTDLQPILALVPPVLSQYVLFGLMILAHVLGELPESKVAWPSPEQMDEYSELIQHVVSQCHNPLKSLSILTYGWHPRPEEL